MVLLGIGRIAFSIQDSTRMTDAGQRLPGGAAARLPPIVAPRPA